MNRKIHFIDELVKLSDSMVRQYSHDKPYRFFHYLCMSVIRAEYLLDDLMSKKIEQISANLKQNNTDIAEERIELIKVFMNMMNDYLFFNRVIEGLIHQKNRSLILDGRKDREYSYVEDYVQQIYILDVKLKNNDPVESIAVYKMFPHIFIKIMKMTGIDHNFLIDTDSFKTLLDLDESLNGCNSIEDKKRKDKDSFSNSESYSFIDVFVKIYESKLLPDTAIICDIIKDLRLFEIKNQSLISKIVLSDKQYAKKFEYLGPRKVITFNSTDIETYDLNRDVFCNKTEQDYNPLGNSNDIVGLYKKYAERMYYYNGFTHYEKKHLEIITNTSNYEKVLKDYDVLMKMTGTLLSNEQRTYKDVSRYNITIAQNIKWHFCIPGRLLKKISHLTPEDYTKHREEVDALLDAEIYPENFFSYCFIIKHIEHYFDLIESKIYSNDKVGTEDFKNVEIVTKLIARYKTNIRKMQYNHFAMNFMSLFEDSFYECKFNKNLECEEVVRLQGIDKEKVCNNDYQNIIFVASTYRNPFGIRLLKRHLRTYSAQRKMLQAKLESKYYQEKEELLKELENVNDKITDTGNTIKQEIDETRRTTVQILGVLASFLALASISLGAFKIAESAMQFLKIMLGMTTCITIFVMLLSYVFPRKEQNGFRKYIQTGILFLLVVLLVLVIIII